MSYDISLSIDTGIGNMSQVEDWNYTSNVAPMWREAGVDLRELNGKAATLCAPLLSIAILEMERNPDKYQAMNPANGWGDSDGCLSLLTMIRDACLLHPMAVLEVSW